jgi:hypothetical protein
MSDIEAKSEAVEELPGEVAPENEAQQRDRQTTIAVVGAVIIFTGIWLSSYALESAYLVAAIPRVMAIAVLIFSLIGLLIKPSVYGVLVAALVAAEFLLLGQVFVDLGNALETIDGLAQLKLQLLSGISFGIILFRVFVTPRPERSDLYRLLWVVLSLVLGLAALVMPLSWAGLRAFTDGAH